MVYLTANDTLLTPPLIIMLLVIPDTAWINEPIWLGSQVAVITNSLLAS
jgi:hypothetical protein